LHQDIMILHDNAKPHAINWHLWLVIALKLGVTDHPPYSPNLTPSEFHLSETLKKNLGHKKFPTDTDIKLPDTSWRQTLDIYLFYARIQALVTW
jgi:hypothetical protein